MSSPPDAAKLIAAYRHYNRPLPPGLADPPELHDIETGLYSAFWELSSERRDALMPIPWSSIRAHSAQSHIRFGVLSPIIRRMDEAYLTHQREKE